MKRILTILVVLIVLGAGAFYAYLYLSPDRNINGLYLVPDDAMYILESDQPIKNWSELSKSGVWQFLKGHPLFADITDDADYLDEMISGNSLLFKLFGSRKFILSAHKTRPGDYDFLFAVDLQKGAKTGTLYNTLEKTLQSSGFKVTARKYKDYELIESTDAAKDVLTLCKVENFLVCSYTSTLVEKAIDALEKPGIARDIYFQDVYKRVNTKGIGRLYVQYSRIDDLMSCYMDQPDEIIQDLSRTLRFTSLDLLVEDEAWEMKGFTNINEQMDSYLLALMRSGKSKNRASEILSNRTAWHLSFNFRSMERFYEELTKVLKVNEESYDEFEKSQKKIERLLGISIKKNLLDWVSDEVSIAQMRSNAYTNRTDNLVVCMRTENMASAKENLNFIAKQVKKRTPAKFKRIEYRNYEIQYLDIKGFFKTFFGKAFQKMEKPYYTAVGDYIVFSNSPLTLIGLIEDFENNRTLSTTEGNIKYHEKAESEASLTIYVSPENTYPLLGKYADLETQKGLVKSKKYLEGFDAFGFQLTSDGAMLNTHAYLHLKNQENSEIVEQLPEDLLNVKYDEYATIKTDVDSVFTIQMIEDGTFKKFFPDGENIEIQSETRDGKLHGKYEEFYITGEIRVRGKYRDGKKDGTWKYYELNGDEREKERF